MKKILVLVGHGFEDVELIATLDVFTRTNITYTIASAEEGDTINSARTKLAVIADVKIPEVINSLDEYDGTFIPGGPGTEDLASKPNIGEVIKHFVDNNKFISAICAAPSILAMNGALKDKDATCYPDEKFINALKENGANYKEQPYVIDGKIITGKDMQSTIKFAYALADTVNETPDENKKILLKSENSFFI